MRNESDPLLNPLFYDIIEANAQMLVPLTPDKFPVLAQKCRIGVSTRILEVSCANGELLCKWAQEYDMRGTGVDQRASFVRLANERANELEVWTNLQFVESDVASYCQPFHQYNIVAHMNQLTSDWTLSEAIHTLRDAVHDEQGGLILLGQLFWQQIPPSDVLQALGIEADMLPQLGDILAQVHAQDVDLYDYLIAEPQDWDAFYNAQWRIIFKWLQDNPDHSAQADMRQQLRLSQQNYFRYERHYIGWGIFILHIPPTVQAQEDMSDYGDWA
jgi:hypothetical protein